MDQQLQELYQQLILDHNSSPRNFGELLEATHTVEGHNPLCGDNLKLFLDVEEGVIREARFCGSGCAISKASSSLMTTALKGMTVDQARDLFETFRAMVTDAEPTAENQKKLGKLIAFSGVRAFPTRVKCATLAWHALNAALSGKDMVSTE